jgi:hypothetical protein
MSYRRRLRVVLFVALLIGCVVSSSVFAQGRSGRSGYGAAGNGRGGEGESADTAPKAPLTYPERAVGAAAGTLAEYQKPTFEHHRFAISPDGTRLALSGEQKPAVETARPPAGKANTAAKGKAPKNNVLEVIDVRTGKPIVSFHPPSLFENLALSPDNQFLAAESADRPNVVYVLHLPTKKSKEFKPPIRKIVPGGLTFSRDGRSIVVAATDRALTIGLGDGATKEVKYEYVSPSAAYCAATNLVATGVSRSRRGKPEVHIYDLAQGKQIKQLDVPSAPLRVQFSNDGQWLAAVIAGGTVGVWQTSDWNLSSSANNKIGYDPGQLAVSADGGQVAVRPRSGAREETKIISVQSGETVQSLKTHEVYYMPNGLLAVASDNGPFYLDVAAGTLAELPPAGADDALAQGDSATAAVGDPSAQSAAPVQTGYGAVSPQPGSQSGYGAAAPQPGSQPGYGAYSPPDAQPGTPQPGQAGRR